MELQSESGLLDMYLNSAKDLIEAASGENLHILANTRFGAKRISQFLKPSSNLMLKCPPCVVILNNNRNARTVLKLNTK